MIKKNVLFFALVSILPLFPCNSSSPIEKRLSLKEAILIALEENEELGAFENSVLAQYEDIGIAYSHYFPKIILDEHMQVTNIPIPAFTDRMNQRRIKLQNLTPNALNNPSYIVDFQTTLAFEQAVYSRKANVELKMAKKAHYAKNDDFERKKEDISLKVIETYFTTITSKAFVAVAEQAVEDAIEHSRIANQKFESGLSLYSDVLSASTAVTHVRAQLVTARKNLAVAKRSLGLLLGTNELIDVTDDRFILPLRGLEYYISFSLTRKDLSSMRLNYENSKNNIALAESSFYPVVNLGAYCQLNDHRRPFGSEGSATQFLASVNWEIFDGTKRIHEKKKAQYLALELKNHLIGLQRLVYFQVETAYLALEEANKNVELLQETVTTAEEARRLVKMRYEKGTSPLFDLLDVQLTLDQSRFDLISRELAQWLAVANLSYESGAILDDLQIE